MSQLLRATLFTASALATEPAQQLNVLFFAVDDLRPVGEFFGEPEVKVPSLDRLAARSTIFTKAYVQAPTCGVSRSSLLTGRRPDTTYVLGNSQCPFNTSASHSQWQSLPEHFRNSGYTTAGLGKIYHPNVCEGAAVGEQSNAWSLPYYHAPCISLGSLYNGSCYEDYPGPVPCGEPCEKITSVYANATAEDDDMPDGMIASEAVKTLQQLANASKPFFLAVGFHKPHLPHIAPKKYFDLYPLDKVSLPANPFAPTNQPDFAWSKSSEWRSYPDVNEFCAVDEYASNQSVSEDHQRQQRQAYFAAASYGDAQMGRVLDELERLNLHEKTIVVLFGDHGWHLGENNEWGKHTAFARANRAPLLFSIPGSRPRVDDATFAEFVDIFPTVADLAGIQVPSRCDTEEASQQAALCHEGFSLAPLVREAAAPTKTAAFSQWAMGKHMGYSVYTALEDGSEVRYTEWVKYDEAAHGPDWTTLSGRELYNRTADPDENESVHAEAQCLEAVQMLSKKLRAGWRAAAPVTNAETLTV